MGTKKITKKKAMAYREVAARAIFDDLQNSEFDVRNQTQSDALMETSLAIADAEAERLMSERESGERNP